MATLVSRGGPDSVNAAEISATLARFPAGENTPDRRSQLPIRHHPGAGDALCGGCLNHASGSDTDRAARGSGAVFRTSRCRPPAFREHSPISQTFNFRSAKNSSPPKNRIEAPAGGLPRLTYIMLDASIAVVRPSTAWRVRSRAGLLPKWNTTLDAERTDEAHGAESSPGIRRR